LLKVFLDRLPYRGLEDTTALPLLVMDSPLHAPAVEKHLRPLLVELGAEVPAPGLAVLESEIEVLDRVLHRWTGQVADAMGRDTGQRQMALSGRH
jgi:FMN reductase